MADVSLTPMQNEAIDWLVTRLSDGEALVALRGLAGTGKTTIIPVLRQTLAHQDIPAVVGSPTHRAAMVLKRKGILDADTIHAHALTPSFLPDYARAMAWLGEDIASKDADKHGTPFPAHDDVNGLPWLIHEQMENTPETRRELRRKAKVYGARRSLESLGIHGRNHFAGFGPKQGNGCLIIDEASMVGEEQLALCQEAFPMVCLVGDPGQLPPVKDVARLATVNGFDLTEIHRQAADSPIIQLAYAAREGQPFWQRCPTHPGILEEWMGVAADIFLEAPLIVWRNSTRLDCTKAIRTQLGYPADAVRIGEPLVCRATDQKSRADGLYNNALFRVAEVSAADSRRVTIQEDCGEATHDVYLHMEELHSERIDPKAVPFRFGYCLTAHTAQGGEWPTVYISKPDMLAYAGFCQRQRHHVDDFARWAYTAITRAKQTLGFLLANAFDRTCQIAVSSLWSKERTMPPKTPATTPTPSVTSPGELAIFGPETEGPAAAPVPDDIPEPATPATVLAEATPATAPGAACTFGEHEALLHGFCQALQTRIMTDVIDQSKGVLRVLDAVYERTTMAVTKLAEQNEHAQYSLADALHKLQSQGLIVMQNPYKATVKAQSPKGFAVTLEVVKQAPEELITAIDGMTQWLATQGYGAIEARV